MQSSALYTTVSVQQLLPMSHQLSELHNQSDLLSAEVIGDEHIPQRKRHKGWLLLVLAICSLLNVVLEPGLHAYSVGMCLCCPDHAFHLSVHQLRP